MPDVFWSLTWQDYHRLCDGFHHRQELEWERTRYIAAMVYNANSKNSKTPQQLVPLKLDKQRVKNKPKVDVDGLREKIRLAQQKLNLKNGVVK